MQRHFVVATAGVLLLAVTSCVRSEGASKGSPASSAGNDPPPGSTAGSGGAAPSGFFQQSGFVEVESAGGPVRFRVELALTDPERARGLMERTQLADDAGMLFIFPRERVQSFWMKNTLIPLDMLFIDAGGVIVGIVENAEPLTLTSRSVGKPSRYVLELNGGTTRRLGIAAGMGVRFEGVSPELVDPRVLAPVASPRVPAPPQPGVPAP